MKVDEETYNRIMDKATELYGEAEVKKRTFIKYSRFCVCCHENIEVGTQCSVMYPRQKIRGNYYIFCHDCMNKIRSKYALILIETSKTAYRKTLGDIIKKIGGMSVSRE